MEAKIYYRRVRLFLQIVFRLWYWKGCETLTFKEWLWKRRIGIKSAWQISCDIHQPLNQ